MGAPLAIGIITMSPTPPRPYGLAASIICDRMLDLRSTLTQIEAGGIDQIHFDVMDGLFVPRYGLYPEVLAAIKSVTNIPVDVHCMVEDIEPYIPVFAKAGADYIVPHVEPMRHVHRTVKLIKDAGVKAGVALNIATPLNVLDYILDDIDLVMLMAINPGIVGHKLIPRALEKIAELKERLEGRNIMIEIDGGVNPESAPLMIQKGATMLVCGTQMIFKPDVRFDEKIREVRENIDRELTNTKAH